MNPKMIELKERIKLNAEYIKFHRLAGHKNASAEHIAKDKELGEQLFAKHPKYDFWQPNDKYIHNMRFYHIAYSMLKGRTYEQVENKVKPEHELTSTAWQTINKIKDSVNE